MCMLLLTLTGFFFAFPIKTFSENNSLEINCLAFLSLFFFDITALNCQLEYKTILIKPTVKKEYKEDNPLRRLFGLKETACDHLASLQKRLPHAVNMEYRIRGPSISPSGEHVMNQTLHCSGIEVC